MSVMTTPESPAGADKKAAGSAQHRIGGGLLDPKMLDRKSVV